MVKETKSKNPRGFPKAKCNRGCPEGSSLSSFSLKNGNKRNYCKPLEEIQQMKKTKKVIKEIEKPIEPESSVSKPKQPKKEKVAKEVIKEEPEWESEKEPNPAFEKIGTPYKDKKDCYSKSAKKLAEEIFGETRQEGCLFLEKDGGALAIASVKDKIYDTKNYKDCKPTGFRLGSDNVIEYLMESNDKKNISVINKGFYDKNLKKFNKSCECGKEFGQPVIMSSQKHDLYIAPRNIIEEEIAEKDIPQAIEKEKDKFDSMDEYEQLQSKSKEELALLSGDKRKSVTKEGHIRWILKHKREKKQFEEWNKIAEEEKKKQALKEETELKEMRVIREEKERSNIMSIEELGKREGLIEIKKPEDLPKQYQNDKFHLETLKSKNTILRIPSSFYSIEERKERSKQK